MADRKCRRCKQVFPDSETRPIDPPQIDDFDDDEEEEYLDQLRDYVGDVIYLCHKCYARIKQMIDEGRVLPRGKSSSALSGPVSATPKRNSHNERAAAI